jgi:chemotaxis protein CheD
MPTLGGPVDGSVTDDIGRQVIGIGGLKVCRGTAGYIVTHALGSCLGVTVWDPLRHIGGMLHAQLPIAQLNPDRAKTHPALFVDLGIPMLIEAAVKLGAEKRRLRIVVAGGANMTASMANDLFNIATRNLTSLRKVCWRDSLLIAAEDTGGVLPRTMTLSFIDGTITIESQGARRIL